MGDFIILEEEGKKIKIIFEQAKSIRLELERVSKNDPIVFNKNGKYYDYFFGKKIWNLIAILHFSLKEKYKEDGWVPKAEKNEEQMQWKDGGKTAIYVKSIIHKVFEGTNVLSGDYKTTFFDMIPSRFEDFYQPMYKDHPVKFFFNKLSIKEYSDKDALSRADLLIYELWNFTFGNEEDLNLRAEKVAKHLFNKTKEGYPITSKIIEYFDIVRGNNGKKLDEYMIWDKVGEPAHTWIQVPAEQYNEGTTDSNTSEDNKTPEEKTPEEKTPEEKTPEEKTPDPEKEKQNNSGENENKSATNVNVYRYLKDADTEKKSDKMNENEEETYEDPEKESSIQLSDSSSGSEYINVDHYWNFYNVMNPKVIIEFKNKNKEFVELSDAVNKLHGIEGTGYAKNINNYFVSLNITDYGSKEIELVLFDRSFTDIQEILSMALYSTNANNSKSTEVKGNADVEGSSVPLTFGIFENNTMSNLRIRFGYGEKNKKSEINNGSSSFENTGMVAQNINGKLYQDRWRDLSSNEKIVTDHSKNLSTGEPVDIRDDTNLLDLSQQSTIMSTASEYFITGLNTVLTETGIKYTIKAVSLEVMELQGYKLLQRYAVIRGRPSDIINSFDTGFSNLFEIRFTGENGSEGDTSELDGEVIHFDYKTGKYQVMDEDRVNSNIESLLKPMKSMNENAKIIRNVSSCISWNPQNDILKKLPSLIECPELCEKNLKELKNNEITGISVKINDPLSFMKCIASSASAGSINKDLPKMSALVSRMSYIWNDLLRLSKSKGYNSEEEKDISVIEFRKVAVAMASVPAFDLGDPSKESVFSKILEKSRLNDEKIGPIVLKLNKLNLINSFLPIGWKVDTPPDEKDIILEDVFPSTKNLPEPKYVTGNRYSNPLWWGDKKYCYYFGLNTINNDLSTGSSRWTRFNIANVSIKDLLRSPNKSDRYSFKNEDELYNLLFNSSNGLTMSKLENIRVIAEENGFADISTRVKNLETAIGNFMSNNISFVADEIKLEEKYISIYNNLYKFEELFIKDMSFQKSFLETNSNSSEEAETFIDIYNCINDLKSKTKYINNDVIFNFNKKSDGIGIKTFEDGLSSSNSVTLKFNQYAPKDSKKQNLYNLYIEEVKVNYLNYVSNLAISIDEKSAEDSIDFAYIFSQGNDIQPTENIVGIEKENSFAEIFASALINAPAFYTYINEGGDFKFRKIKNVTFENVTYEGGVSKRKIIIKYETKKISMKSKDDKYSVGTTWTDLKKAYLLLLGISKTDMFFEDNINKNTVGGDFFPKKEAEESRVSFLSINPYDDNIKNNGCGLKQAQLDAVGYPILYDENKTIISDQSTLKLEDEDDKSSLSYYLLEKIKNFNDVLDISKYDPETNGNFLSYIAVQEINGVDGKGGIKDKNDITWKKFNNGKDDSSVENCGQYAENDNDIVKELSVKVSVDHSPINLYNLGGNNNLIQDLFKLLEYGPSGFETNVDYGKSIYYADSLKCIKSAMLVKIGKIKLEAERRIKETDELKALGVGKIIEIPLGGPSAVNNYNDSGKPRTWKNISSIFNEFCSKVPPKISSREKIAVAAQEVVRDENGNIKKDETGKEITETNLGSDGKEKNSGTATFPNEDGEDETANLAKEYPRYSLGWNVSGTNESGKPIINFYWKKPYFPKKIRKYNWGTGNAVPHCVKGVNISMGNEFAFLSQASMLSINSNGSMNAKFTADGNNLTANVSTSVGNEPNVATTVSTSESENNVINNMRNTISKGTITLLGDPSLKFYRKFQPYMTPIYLNIILPNTDYGYLYNSVYTDQKNKYQLSGHYVICKIMHSISISGFDTTLEVMKYPGSDGSTL